MLDLFEVPSWAGSSIAMLLALGFQIACVFAWAFELTPEGIKRKHEVDLEALNWRGQWFCIAWALRSTSRRFLIAALLPEPDCLCQMDLSNTFRSIQVGDGAGYLQHPLASTGREAEPLRRLFEE